MRIKICILSFLLCFQALTGFAQWSWRNPLPQGNHLKASWFIDDNNGYAVGDVGTIMKTTDGGQTWSIKNLNDIWHDMDFKGICFPDATTGFAADYVGFVFRTTDGGNTWDSVYFDPDEYVNGVYFTDALHGFLACSGGKIVKTVDGGITWQGQYWPSHDNLSSVWFPTLQVGYIAGYRGLILKTVDGGSTWWCMHFDTTEYLNSVHFVSPEKGFAAGWHGVVLKTVDGGLSWTLHNLGDSLTIYSISMFNDTSLLMSAVMQAQYPPLYQWLLLKSTDGGFTWANQPSALGNFSSQNIFCLQDGFACATGYEGFISKTNDFGNSWSILSTCLTNINHYGAAINAIDFPTANTGYAVAGGHEMPTGTVIKTTDGGYAWFQLDSSFYIHTFNAVKFTSENSGFIAGDNIYSTNDGGNTWICRYNAIYWGPIYSIDFATPAIGVAVGNDSIFLRTTDSGQTWGPVASVPHGSFRCVCFSNTNTGFASGYDLNLNTPVTIKTTDAGATWSVIPMPGILNSMCFPDPMTGYGVGSGGLVVKTTDGGMTWTQLGNPTGQPLYGVHFYDADTGFVTGGAYEITCIMIKTTDGGLTWHDQTIPSLTPLDCVHVTAGYNVYAGGEYGFLFGTTNGGGYTGIKEPSLVRSKPFSEFFPNPASGYTNIRYTLQEHAHVVVKIFDHSGTEITTLTNGNQAPGTYSIPFTTAEYPSGIYFYRITINDLTETGKIIVAR